MHKDNATALRTTLAVATIACAFGATSSAWAEGWSFNLGPAYRGGMDAEVSGPSDAAVKGVLAAKPAKGSVPKLGGDAVAAPVVDTDVGFTFDNGNFLLGGDVPTAIYQSMQARICHVHIKDMAAVPANEKASFAAPDGTGYRGCYLGMGDAKVDECLALLKQDGYDGWLSAEINSAKLDEARHALHYIAKTWQQ
jgi:hypothetical protein